MEYTFVGDHVTYSSFFLSFPGFVNKHEHFSNSLSFPGFPCFPGLWPPCFSVNKIPLWSIVHKQEVTSLGNEFETRRLIPVCTSTEDLLP